MATQEDSKKWTHNYKNLLITARLEMEADFRAKKKKRYVLWERVLQNIKSIDDTFPFSRDDIYRKFLNFMVTYKRIKKRNRTSGEAATTWEYYDRLDEVYGCRSDIFVPECNLESTLEGVFADFTEDNNEPCTSQAVLTQHENSTPARKRNRVDVVEFLTKESQADRKLLEDLLNCEKEKLKFEKEKLKFEKEKLEEIRKLREAILSARK